MAREMLLIGDERTPYQLCSPAWQRPAKPAPLGGSPIPRPAAPEGQIRCVAGQVPSGLLEGSPLVWPRSESLGELALGVGYYLCSETGQLCDFGQAWLWD